MCETFPEVSTCCLCVSLRVGMLFISVISIMTGVVGLSVLVNSQKINYKEIYTIPETYKNITNSKTMKASFKYVNKLSIALLSIFSLYFMFGGTMLFFGTLYESEGLVQVFVWGTFLNVILGMLVLCVTSFECIAYDDSCMLTRHMTWFFAGVSVFLCVLYLILWIYFITVANSYVINGDD